jgi:hypothetical protein
MLGDTLAIGDDDVKSETFAGLSDDDVLVDGETLLVLVVRLRDDDIVVEQLAETELVTEMEIVD